ncbi:MAG: oxidoreductase [Planctomycetaceae bacterium]|nr:oxidoreductase [Planctomycetaceae bacterium]
MNTDLASRTALVTGGGTGIGRGMSLALAANGAAVVVNYSRSRDDAENTVEAINQAGGRAVAVQADITEESQVKHLIQQTVDAFGGLDILIANAGGRTRDAPTIDLTREDWDHGIALNCTSVFLCVKHAVEHLPDQIGRIIVTSSISARSGAGPGMVIYAAAKGVLNNMVRNWAKELGPRRITVNAIAPGVIRTRLHAQFTPPDEYKKLIERVPVGRDGLPEDCAGATVLLAGDAGSYITGQTIEINGGMAMP